MNKLLSIICSVAITTAIVVAISFATNNYYNHTGAFVSGTAVSSSDMNAKFNGIEDGFDKLPAPDAGAPGTKGFSETFVILDGTARNHPATVGQVQDNGFTYAAWAESSTDVYTLDLTPDIADYSEGQIFCGSPAADNTGAVTIAVDGKAAKAIKRLNGDALEAGDLDADGIYCIGYDGTDFALLGTPKTFDQNVNTTDDVVFGSVTTDTITDPGSSGVEIDGVTVGGACAGCIAITEGGTGATTAAGALTNISAGIQGFAAYISTAEVITSGDDNLLENWTEIYDSGTVWDEAGTTDEFIPSLAGKYLYTVDLTWYNGTAGDETCEVSIYLNGAAYQTESFICIADEYTSTRATGIVDMNGTDDSLTFYVDQDSGNDTDINVKTGTDPYYSIISATWIAP